MSARKKYDFTGKVVLVTGSSSGIGAGIATQFAQFGALLVITGRNGTNLSKVADQIEHISGHKPLQMIGDLLDSGFVAKLVPDTIAHFGRLDVLVNNAGGSSPDDTDFDNCNLLDAYDKVMALNVRSVLQLTQAAVPFLQVNRGNIVNISSDSSMNPWKIIYSTSKSALDMLTKTSAASLASKKIRVNSVNPGPVFTAFGRSMGDEQQFRQDLQQYKAHTALDRIATPEDIANVVAFLASDDAVNMTGSIVLTDGGYTVFQSFS